MRSYFGGTPEELVDMLLDWRGWVWTVLGCGLPSTPLISR